MAAIVNHIDTILQAEGRGSLPTIDWTELTDNSGTMPDNNATNGATVGINLDGTFSAANVLAFFAGNTFTTSTVPTLFATAAIGEAYIGNLSANKITSGTISASTIDVSKTITSNGSYVGTYAGNFTNTGSGGYALKASGLALGVNVIVTNGTGVKIRQSGTASNTGLDIDLSGSTTSSGIVSRINSAGGIYAGYFAGSGDAYLSRNGVAGQFDTSSNTTAIVATCSNGSSLSHAIRGRNSSDGTAGLVGSSAGYDFYAEGSASDYGPFTGAHDALMNVGENTTIGDIVIDNKCIHKKGISNTIFEVAQSIKPNQKAAVGIIAHNRGLLNDCSVPAAFNDGFYEEEKAGKKKYKKQKILKNIKLDQIKSKYNRIIINALGEGQINVCGENGDLEAGDLIVTSSIPGKGMKQADDIVRGYTVAKCRENAQFKSKSEVKMVACIYLCG